MAHPRTTRGGGPPRFHVALANGAALADKVGASGSARPLGAPLNQTVVVLEDDAEIRRLIQYRLESAGYAVRMYASPGAIVQDAERQRPALFLLDIMVPGGSGLDVCRQLRRSALVGSVPVIFLTARASEDDRVLGLELGADDYIVKPFAVRELLARVRAVLRRSEAPDEPAALTVLSVEDLQIDSGSMQVRVRGELITTTTTEFRLLEYLARHPGRVFSRDQLLDAVWGDSRFVTPAQRGCVCPPAARKDRVGAGDAPVPEDVAGSGVSLRYPLGPRGCCAGRGARRLDWTHVEPAVEFIFCGAVVGGGGLRAAQRGVAVAATAMDCGPARRGGGDRRGAAGLALGGGERGLPAAWH